MDDHSYYHYHPHDTESLENEEGSAAIDDLETEKSGEEEEVRDGTLDLKDTESRSSRLERLKSSKSIKDPNLVSLFILSIWKSSTLPDYALVQLTEFHPFIS